MIFCRRHRWIARGAYLLAVGLLLHSTGCQAPAKRSPPPPPQQPSVRRVPVRPMQPLPPRPAPLPSEPAPLPRMARVVTIGKSVRGEPIQMHLFGNGPRPALVFGGIHGDERNSSIMAERLIEFLHRNPQFVQNRSIAVIPHANPDGLRANTRGNANKVDLNRNFPASNWKSQKAGRHGESPLSEPEARALAQVVQQLNPRVIISLHSISSGAVCNNYDGPGKPLAELMKRFNGYPAKDSIGYPTPGSFGTWAGKDRGIPTITLEIPKKMPGNQGWEENRQAILAALERG